jgi:hypothetical protein
MTRRHSSLRHRDNASLESAQLNNKKLTFGVGFAVFFALMAAFIIGVAGGSALQIMIGITALGGVGVAVGSYVGRKDDKQTTRDVARRRLRIDAANKGLDIRHEDDFRLYRDEGSKATIDFGKAQTNLDKADLNGELRAKREEQNVLVAQMHRKDPGAALSVIDAIEAHAAVDETANTFKNDDKSSEKSGAAKVTNGTNTWLARHRTSNVDIDDPDLNLSDEQKEAFQNKMNSKATRNP